MSRFPGFPDPKTLTLSNYDEDSNIYKDLTIKLQLQMIRTKDDLEEINNILINDIPEPLYYPEDRMVLRDLNERFKKIHQRIDSIHKCLGLHRKMYIDLFASYREYCQYIYKNKLTDKSFDQETVLKLFSHFVKQLSNISLCRKLKRFLISVENRMKEINAIMQSKLNSAYSIENDDQTKFQNLLDKVMQQKK